MGEVAELIERGVLAYVTGRIPDAVAVFQRVLELDPDNAKARGYLILVQATHPDIAAAPPPAPPPSISSPQRPRTLPPAPPPPPQPAPAAPAAARTVDVSAPRQAPPPPPPPPRPEPRAASTTEPYGAAAPPQPAPVAGAKLRLPAPPKPKKRSLPFDLDSDAFVGQLTTKSPMAPKDFDAQSPAAPAGGDAGPFAGEPAPSPFAVEPGAVKPNRPLEEILFAPTPVPGTLYAAAPEPAPSPFADPAPFSEPAPFPEPPLPEPAHDRFAAEPPVRPGSHPTPMLPVPAHDDAEYAPSPWDDGPSGATIVLSDEPSGGLDLAAVAEKSDLRPLVPEGKAPSPPPAHGPPTDVELWLKAAKELFALGDFTGSLELIEKILTVDPDHVEARDYLRQNEATLVSMYESKLGALTAVPRLAIKPEEVMWLNLDHRAGFLLAQIDGAVDFEGLFALSGLPRLDTARILANLIADGVVKV
ncbi:MAG: tetratricopeptide repeat protein [Anaeromyxobacter sp.]